MTRSTAASRPAAHAPLVPLGWAALAVVTSAVAAVAIATAPLGVAQLGASATRAGMAVAGVACAGLALIGLLLPFTGSDVRDAIAVRRNADRAIVVAAGAWIGFVLLGVGFRAADAFGVPVGGLTGGRLARWSTELAAGRGMLLTAGCAVVVLGCAVARLRESGRVSLRVPLVAALLGTLTPAVTGHSGAAPDHQLAVVAIALHVGAAALWVGGLGALLVLVAPRRRLLVDAVPRFSTLAGWCVGTVALTGLVNAWVRVASWGALVTTGYGVLVLAKVACLAGLGWLGLLARRRLAAGRTPVLRWAGAEVALMAVTLGIAAALTQAG